MADLEKVILEVPNLPNHIQGDGRQLMSLLKSFLKQTAEQVNLANGFSAEEINPELGGYPTPRNFFLSFTPMGGEFSWTHINDVSQLAYYELRENENVGENAGLLERTLENFSTSLPVNNSGTVFLYAVSLEGVVSNPAKLNYAKPVPDAPQDISTTRTTEGTLITFREIPTNCLGANIYIDDRKFQSSDNVFLTTLAEISKIEVAYYDQFGEGERTTYYLTLPDVTGFLVERNGDELDFYWDALNVYNIKYVVKVGPTPVWNEATELFRTATNDKNRRIYPNRGTYYLLVKAYDGNGNYSKNAAYQVLTTESDINRNVILQFDQQEVLYNGAKVNMYYDPVLEGVTLDREAIRGEYVFGVKFDQKYRARNWIEYSTFSVTSSDLTWEDADFAWEDADQRWVGVVGDVDSGTTKHQIALKQDITPHTVFSATMNGNLITDALENPLDAQDATVFQNGRWAFGVKVDNTTRITYDVAMEKTMFSMVFFIKTLNKLGDTIFAMLYAADTSNSLIIGYDARLQCIYMLGSDGERNEIPYITTSVMEYFTIGINQNSAERTLFVNIYSTNSTLQSTLVAAPLGTFTRLHLYPSDFIQGSWTPSLGGGNGTLGSAKLGNLVLGATTSSGEDFGGRLGKAQLGQFKLGIKASGDNSGASGQIILGRSLLGKTIIS